MRLEDVPMRFYDKPPRVLYHAPKVEDPVMVPSRHGRHPHKPKKAFCSAVCQRLEHGRCTKRDCTCVCHKGGLR